MKKQGNIMPQKEQNNPLITDKRILIKYLIKNDFKGVLRYKRIQINT